jgi:hypothetical protein
MHGSVAHFARWFCREDVQLYVGRGVEEAVGFAFWLCRYRLSSVVYEVDSSRMCNSSICNCVCVRQDKLLSLASAVKLHRALAMSLTRNLCSVLG